MADVTLVSKGKVKGYSSVWIDPERVGYTSFLKVTKIGQKYIYGVHFYFENEDRKETFYEDKISIEDNVIL